LLLDPGNLCRVEKIEFACDSPYITVDKDNYVVAIGDVIIQIQVYRNSLVKQDQR